MPSLIDLLLHPTRTPPPPVAVDLGRAMLVGTAVWGAACLVMVVLALAGEASWKAVMVCVTGAILGVLGFLWARRNSARHGSR